MFNNIQLRNDPTKLDTISTMRVMVTIPVLYMFMVKFVRLSPTIFFRFFEDSKETSLEGQD